MNILTSYSLRSNIITSNCAWRFVDLNQEGALKSDSNYLLNMDKQDFFV